MVLSTLIDGLILALLAGVLLYAGLLDRRVRTLMKVLRELEPLVGQFSTAVEKSELSVRRLAGAEARERGSRMRSARAADIAPAIAGGGDVAPVRGFTSMPGKSDLVRSFFEATRERGA